MLSTNLREDPVHSLHNSSGQGFAYCVLLQNQPRTRITASEINTPAQVLCPALTLPSSHHWLSMDTDTLYCDTYVYGKSVPSIHLA